MIGRETMRSSCKWIGALCAGAVLAGGAAGCSDEAPSGTVQILHWWNAGGEAQAIDALLGAFRRQHPSIRVIDISGDGGSSDARVALASKMDTGNPPDTFQANGGWDLMSWVLYDTKDPTSGKMAPIDDIAGEWWEHVPSEVRDSVSVGEPAHVYGVPLNVHRLNTLFYNKRIFEEINENPNDVTSLEKLFEVAEKVRTTKAIAPIALGYGDQQEWVLSLLFHENLLVARDRGRMYKALFQIWDPMDPMEELDPFSPEFLPVLDDFGKLISYANDNPDRVRWDEAMDRVLKGEAAMTIMGDWAKGYADADSVNRDKVGFIPTPGTGETFVFTTDTFGLPNKQDLAQLEATKTLLSFFGSPDGQRIFNEKKGSISARVDVEPPESDARRPTFDAFSNPAIIKIAATSILAQQVYVDAISRALATYANDLREGTATYSEIQHTIDNYRDVLAESWK